MARLETHPTFHEANLLHGFIGCCKSKLLYVCVTYGTVQPRQSMACNMTLTLQYISCDLYLDFGVLYPVLLAGVLPVLECIP